MPSSPVAVVVAAPVAVSPEPAVSVVVPALNEERYLGECLASLMAQTGVAFEVIVVDNGSTDGTSAVAAAAGARVVHEPRRGVCNARQAGLAAARGEVVVSADADTVYPAGWLAGIRAAFADPEVVGWCGPVRFAGAPAWAGAWTGALFGAVRLVTRITGRPPYAAACNLAYRRTAFTGYDTHLTQGADELAVLRALRGRGRVLFDRHARVDTSARRVTRGLLYNVVVTFLLLYLLEYGVGRLTRRTLFGHAPAFRDSGRSRGPRMAGAGAALLVAVVTARALLR
ncbi:MAG: glycosyltransferase family 2 protein [Thermoleophilia bacterium]